MNKQDLIKLAKIAGHDFIVNLMDAEFEVLNWNPHKDIAQAFEVLEGWRKLDIENEAFIRVRSSYNGGDYCVSLTTANVGSGKLPEAICKAVLKAIEGGKE